MFWNATFAHAEVLNYPEILRYSKIVKSQCKGKRNGEGDGDGVYAGGENRSSYDDDENDDYYNNWAPSRALIGRELCSIRVQTMEMTRWWCNLLVACDFPRNVNGNGRQKLLFKKQIDNNFPWCVLLLTIEMTLLKTLQWNHEPHLSFEQCDVISIGNCCQFVKMIIKWWCWLWRW